MPTLSRSQTSDLDENIGNIDQAITHVKSVVKQYNLPNDYDAAYHFMNEQRSAAERLRDTGSLGCTIESVGSSQAKIEQLIAAEHLANQAHLARTLDETVIDGQPSKLDRIKTITHDIKGKLAAASVFASDDLNRIVGEIASVRHGSSDKNLQRRR